MQLLFRRIPGSKPNPRERFRGNGRRPMGTRMLALTFTGSCTSIGGNKLTTTQNLLVPDYLWDGERCQRTGQSNLPCRNCSMTTDSNRPINPSFFYSPMGSRQKIEERENKRANRSMFRRFLTSSLFISIFFYFYYFRRIVHSAIIAEILIAVLAFLILQRRTMKRVPKWLIFDFLNLFLYRINLVFYIILIF